MQVELESSNLEKSMSHMTSAGSAAGAAAGGAAASAAAIAATTAKMVIKTKGAADPALVM